MVVIFLLMILVAKLFMKLTQKMEELARYKEVWKTIRDAIPLQQGEDPCPCELESGPFSDEESEEERPYVIDKEETFSEQLCDEVDETLLAESSGIQQPETTFRRRRVLQREVQHGSAEGEDPNVPRDGGDGGDRPDEDDESFEVEVEVDESPRMRYQRYLQSTMEEVSDVDEWTNVHYGFVIESDDDGGDNGAPTTRSRSRASDDKNPQPKAMPKPLAKQVARRIAQDVAEDMIEAIENSGAGPSASTQPSTPGHVNDINYYLSSVPMATFFNITPVPREPLALDDYRWDLLGQGVGPENFLVHNCRDLSRSIPLMTCGIDRERHLRLLRQLQNLLIRFQSGKPEEWIRAAEQVRDWIQHDGAVDFFEDAPTEAGESDDDERNEQCEGEGEEEDRDDSDRSYDCDDDEEDNTRPQRARVADRGSSSAAGADGGAGSGASAADGSSAAG